MRKRRCYELDSRPQRLKESAWELGLLEGHGFSRALPDRVLTQAKARTLRHPEFFRSLFRQFLSGDYGFQLRTRGLVGQGYSFGQRRCGVPAEALYTAHIE